MLYSDMIYKLLVKKFTAKSKFYRCYNMKLTRSKSVKANIAVLSDVTLSSTSKTNFSSFVLSHDSPLTTTCIPSETYSSVSEYSKSQV